MTAVCHHGGVGIGARYATARRAAGTVPMGKVQGGPRVKKLWLLLAVLAGTLVGARAVAPAGAVPPTHDNRGTDFWVAFPANLDAAANSVLITGDTATTGTID